MAINTLAVHHGSMPAKPYTFPNKEFAHFLTHFATKGGGKAAWQQQKPYCQCCGKEGHIKPDCCDLLNGCE